MFNLLKRIWAAWMCPSCGSLNEDGAARCWNCGRYRP